MFAKRANGRKRLPEAFRKEIWGKERTKDDGSVTN